MNVPPDGFTRIDNPAADFYRLYDGAAELAEKGRYTAEIAEWRRALALNPDDSRALYMAANGLVALGERERGLEWASRARALDPDDPMLLYNVGCIYSSPAMSTRRSTASSSRCRTVSGSASGWSTTATSIP